MKILLADNSILILNRLQNIVLGYDKVTLTGMYRNGMDALIAMRETPPDLAIIDIKMPGITGLEVLHEIRKENKTMKIMFLTLYSSTHYRKKAMMDGADYFFSKAEDFDKIHLVIEEMLLTSRKPNNRPAVKQITLRSKTTIKPI